MFRIITILFTSILISFASNVNASHIAGADINWEQIGEDTFLITINTYRDCNSFNNSIENIKVSSACGSYKFTPTQSVGIDVTPVCEEQGTRCDHRGISFQYGFELYKMTGIFVATSMIKNGCCNFEIEWLKCCRNGRISTGLANKEIYVAASFNACANLDVAWDNTEIPILCLGRDAHLQLSANTNNPKDSIAYSITEPLRDVATPIKYSTPYNYIQFLYYLGFPKTNLVLPRGIHLDSTSGLLQFRPMKVEHTATAFKAEIFRNGVKIGETYKDISFVVIKCPDNKPPVVSGFDASFSAKDYSRIICANSTSKFTFSTTDEDYKDTVSLSSTSSFRDSMVSIIPGAKRDSVHWYWTPDTSFISDIYHNLFITAEDNACPVKGKSAQLYRIKVVDEKTLKPIIKQQKWDSCGSYKLSMVDSLNKPISADWYDSQKNFIGTGSSVFHEFKTAGKHIISAKINGCDSIAFFDTVDVDRINNLKINFNDTAVCAMDIELDPKLKGNNGPATFNWTLDPQLNYTGSTNTSTLAIDLKSKPGLKNIPISLSITDSVGCKIENNIALSSKYSQTKIIDRGGTFCQLDPIKKLKTDLGKGQWHGEGIINNTMHFDKLTQGTYIVEFVNSDDAVCFIDTAKFIVNQSPSIVLDADFTTCTSAELKTLDAKPKGGTWSGDGIISNEFDAKIAGKGLHELVYFFTNNVGCSNSDSLQVNVLDYIPTVNISNSASACKNEKEVSLTSNVNSGTWSGNGIISSLNPTVLKVDDLKVGKTTFNYKYIDSNQCVFEDSSVVLINQVPTPSFSVSKTYYHIGDLLAIKNTTNNITENDYYWTLGSPIIVTSNSVDFKEKTTETGIFDVTLIAKNKQTNCSDTIIKTDAIKVGSVGIPHITTDIKVYPNPVETQLIIDTKVDIESINIFSLDGREVKTINTLKSNTIDVSSLQKGMYILKIQGAKSNFNYTFIKE